MTEIGTLYNRLKNLIKQNFYDKTEIDTYIGDINDFIDSNDTEGISTITDSVTDNDMRPVTSNAVYDAIQDNNSELIAKSNTAGLVKNDGTIDTTSYLSSHQDITGKVNIAQGSGNGNKLVVTDNSGNITVGSQIDEMNSLIVDMINYEPPTLTLSANHDTVNLSGSSKSRTVIFTANCTNLTNATVELILVSISGVISNTKETDIYIGSNGTGSYEVEYEGGVNRTLVYKIVYESIESNTITINITGGQSWA